MTLTVIIIGVSTTLVVLVVLHRVWSVNPAGESKPSFSAQIYNLGTWNDSGNDHQVLCEPTGDDNVDGMATGNIEEPKRQNQ